MRVDAKAEGMSVAIGGWSPAAGADGQICTWSSSWFSIVLTESSAPWAFYKGLPAKAISALELLASTVGLMVLTPAALGTPGAAGSVSITGLTDSQVSTHVVTRGLSTSFPLCAVAMELSAQLEARECELHLDWVPRDQNAQADALADGKFQGFSPCRRVPVDFAKVRWLVLDRLMAHGQKCHAELLRAKAGNRRARKDAQPRRRSDRLRDRDPL